MRQVRRTGDVPGVLCQELLKMLENLLVETAVYSGSVVADLTSTYYGVKRLGAEMEQNLRVRNSIFLLAIGKFTRNCNADFDILITATMSADIGNPSTL